MHIYADLFSTAKSLANSIGSVGSVAALVTIGVLALVEAARGRHGAALMLLVVALIPLWFLLDPTGATNAYRSTVSHFH